MPEMKDFSRVLHYTIKKTVSYYSDNTSHSTNDYVNACASPENTTARRHLSIPTAPTTIPKMETPFYLVIV
jgi:hypothetical protein